MRCDAEAWVSTLSLSLAFAFGIAVCATAADTHDYSTYVKLKADTTLGYAVGGGWPGGRARDKWDPGAFIRIFWYNAHTIMTYTGGVAWAVVVLVVLQFVKFPAGAI